MRKCMQVVAAVVALAASAAGQAASSPPLTLDECIRLAEGAQSNVSIARQQAEIARYGLTQARAGFLPQVHFGGGFTYNKTGVSGSLAGGESGRRLQRPRRREERDRIHAPRRAPAACSPCAMAQATLRLFATPKTTALRPARLLLMCSLDEDAQNNRGARRSRRG